MRAVAALALALSALSLPLAAHADETAEGKAARAAFQKGQTEYNLGNYDEAARQFEETYRIKPVPALLFNIAQCYRFMGNLDKAVQTYRAYLRNAPANDKNIALANELLQQVETALASKHKAEQSAPHGLASTTPETPVVPPQPQPARVVPASTRPAAPVEAVSLRPAAPQSPRVYTWVAGGAAAVALAGGAVFGLKSKSTVSGLQSGYHPRADIDAQTAAAKSDASKATVFLAAGAALAVATGALFALHF